MGKSRSGDRSYRKRLGKKSKLSENWMPYGRILTYVSAYSWLFIFIGCNNGARRSWQNSAARIPSISVFTIPPFWYASMGESCSSKRFRIMYDWIFSAACSTSYWYNHLESWYSWHTVSVWRPLQSKDWRFLFVPSRNILCSGRATSDFCAKSNGRCHSRHYGAA